MHERVSDGGVVVSASAYNCVCAREVGNVRVCVLVCVLNDSPAFQITCVLSL